MKELLIYLVTELFSTVFLEDASLLANGIYSTHVEPEERLHQFPTCARGVCVTTEPRVEHNPLLTRDGTRFSASFMLLSASPVVCLDVCSRGVLAVTSQTLPVFPPPRLSQIAFRGRLSRAVDWTIPSQGQWSTE